MGVGVARRVEPIAGPVFPITGRSKQAVEQLHVRPIGEELIEIGLRRRQSRQVERGAASQDSLVGFSGRLQALQPVADEDVDRIALGHGGPHRGFVGPVGGPRSALVDPALERGDLFRRQFFMGRRRRHHALRPGLGDPRKNRGAITNQRVLLVQTKASHARTRVGAVTLKTVVSQDRPNFALIIDGQQKAGRTSKQEQRTHCVYSMPLSSPDQRHPDAVAPTYPGRRADCKQPGSELASAAGTSFGRR